MTTTVLSQLLASYGDGNAQQVSLRMRTLIETLANIITSSTLLNVNAAVSGYLNLVGGPLHVSALPAPVGITATSSTPSGPIQYAYRITSLSVDGESLPSPEVLVNNNALNSGSVNTLTWPQVVGAYGYRIYGRTAGAELFMISQLWDGVSATNTFVDNGGITPAGALPVDNSTGNLIVDGMLELTNAGGATGWQSPITLGTYFMWISSDGKLRINAVAPTSDFDGTEPGTYSTDLGRMIGYSMMRM